MLITKKPLLLLLFFAFFGYYSSPAQQTSEQTTLKDLLLLLENKFDVKFSYLDEQVVQINIEQIPDFPTLDEYIVFIENEIRFDVIRISEQYLAVRKSVNNIDKLCGYLIDSLSGETVDRAVVSYGSNMTITDSLGFFEFNYDGPSVLELRHVRFESKKLDIITASDSCLQILFSPRTETLDELIIRNFIASGIDKELNGATVIHNAQLQTLPGLFDADVLQSLQILPGVQSAIESVSDINVRGGTNDQNLIHWDGIRMYQTGHFFGLISIFNPYFTDQVKLVKNGTSAQYGQTVSSTIMIKTRQEQVEEFSAEAGVSMLSADLSVSLPISSKTALYLGGRHSLAGFLQTPTYDQYYKRAFGELETERIVGEDTLKGNVDKFDYYDVGMKLIHKFDDNQSIQLSLLSTGNELDFTENLLTNQAQELSKSSSVTQKNTGIGLSHQKIWNAKTSSGISAYYSKYQLNSGNNDLLNDQQLFQENTVLDWGTKINVKRNIKERLKINFGYQFHDIGVLNKDRLNNPEFERSVKEVIQEHATFVQGEYKSPTKQTILTSGLRWNHYRHLSQSYFEPRLVVTQLLSKSWSMDFAGEIKTQNTLQVIDRQNDFLGVEKRRWVLSNNVDIPVIKSRQLSLGLNYAQKRWLMSMDLYQKHVDGIISSSQGFQNQFEFLRSSGNYRVTGMDFLLNYKNDQWSNWFSYTISRNLNEFNELHNKRFPSSIDIRHFITHGASYRSNRIELAIGYNWHTGNPFTPPAFDNAIVDGLINYQSPNSANLSNYFRLDISAKYKIAMASRLNGEIGFSIWNLTSYNNVINRYYIVNNVGNLEQIDEFGLQFTPNLMARITF